MSCAESYGPYYDWPPQATPYAPYPRCEPPRNINPPTTTSSHVYGNVPPPSTSELWTAAAPFQHQQAAVTNTYKWMHTKRAHKPAGKILPTLDIFVH
ncbi:hypothetical protein Y032_0047g1451 [Ancylostoma ceylanicum]|uniref:Uncharacterized protein n=1 Tax=Ancylostoma ceylanicum TaxID=53326 RepID=A0A016UC19_9BILA|nr:hypothetical protein Y032_0047g1451 [Ancylostoma ceylanicum]